MPSRAPTADPARSARRRHTTPFFGASARAVFSSRSGARRRPVRDAAPHAAADTSRRRARAGLDCLRAR
eukprot:2040381-Prymnesium_polylepis.1